MSNIVRSSSPPPVGVDSLGGPASIADFAVASPAAQAFERRVALAIVVIPLLGFVAGVYVLWGTGMNLTQLGILMAMYVLTGLGITMGFHRLFTHRAFRTTRGVRLALAIAGSMAAEGPVVFWTAVHRHHHRFSDREGDPHSPHLRENSVRGLLRGLWHAHVGWVFVHKPENLLRYAPDLLRDADIIRVNQLYFVWVVGGIAVPGLLGGLLTWTWTGAGLGVLWGGLARMFLVHHVTWSVNSICHVYGSRPYQTRDQSTNNLICALLSFGEGWHNNHHAFPTSARHGLAWWQIDVTYLLIRVLAGLGLASDILLPKPGEVDGKQNRPVARTAAIAEY